MVFVGLYLLGAGAMLIRLGWRLARLARLSSREPIVFPDGLRVVYLEDDCPPFSFFRTVFVPRPSEGDEDAMAQVVAHERAHIRQAHSIDVLVVHLAGVLQWFNPVVWGYRHALTDLHEFLADREVQSNGNGGNTLKVSLSDPAAMEDMIAKISGKLEKLEEKRASTTDAEMLAKIDQDVKTLTMTRKELKAKLAELKSGQPK